jgi:hypothetical protein
MKLKDIMEKKEIYIMKFLKYDEEKGIYLDLPNI